MMMIMMMMMMNSGSCVGPQNKMGHPAHRHRHLMQIPVLSARGIQISSKTCVTVFLGLGSEIMDII